MEKVTFVMTSCNRFDLLSRTLDSFLALNNYPIEKFIIHEDSGVDEAFQKIKNKYGNLCDIIFPTENKNQAKAIDRLYNSVDTEYIFHCEEDWFFLNNPNFISDSLEILKNYPDIHQVWIRNDANAFWIEREVYTINNVSFRKMKAPHLGIWNGFSWNPGLRRKSDYLKMFPNGFNEFCVQGSNSEYNCCVHSENFKYRAAILLNYACHHIGYGQSTY